MKQKKTNIHKRRILAVLTAFILAAGAICPVFAETVSGTAAGKAAAASPPVFAAPSVTGALHVEGTSLVGAKGQKVQLRGVSTHGLAWFPAYVNEACFRQLRQEYGANVVRLALYTEEYGGYCSGGDQKALKQLIRDGVQAALKQDLYVIVDWHVLNDRDPNTHVSEAKAFFSEMAGEFAGMDHVIYEICNEPNGGTSWAAVKKYALQVIPAIRAKDPDAVIIVGTPNWSQYVDQAAADPIKEYDNILYALHFYAATHKSDLRQKMTAAVEAGLPVFVSEFGICDASGNGSIDETEADRWVAEMDRLGISYVMWSLCNKAESASMIASSCTGTSGFTEKDLTAAGKWLVRTLEERRGGISMGSILSNIHPKFRPGKGTVAKRKEIP
ncbi:MAG: glycoside hydrolase family 5 protein [Firmicutes bacterium]|nr:glycoside hydrolase family 5 protein [Bacillota bacterium]